MAARAGTAPTSEEALELSEVVAALDTDRPPISEPPTEALVSPLVSDARTEPRMLAVPLTPEVYEALEKAARRNGVPPAQLVVELLENWLKYR